jgi:Flp pilus assembly CpaE family ATPase
LIENFSAQADEDIVVLIVLGLKSRAGVPDFFYFEAQTISSCLRLFSLLLPSIVLVYL